ncbi:MAG: phosphatase PAP2 family protein [Burkholderiales bacterium]
MTSESVPIATAARRALSIGVLVLTALPCSAQNCGWSRIDHRVSLNNSGMWNPNVYRSIVGALSVAGLGGAIWEGSETRFGKTMWQGAEAEAIGGLSATAGKYIFTRERPSETDNPCLWFQGGSNYSFPSGEAAVAAALVTPYVLEYGSDQPAVYALLLLPLYVGVGRIKNQDHWQSDVLAGWAVGGLSGWLSHSLETPITIQLLPHGVAVGLKAKF